MYHLRLHSEKVMINGCDMGFIAQVDAFGPGEGVYPHVDVHTEN